MQWINKKHKLISSQCAVGMSGGPAAAIQLYRETLMLLDACSAASALSLRWRAEGWAFHMFDLGQELKEREVLGPLKQWESRCLTAGNGHWFFIDILHNLEERTLPVAFSKYKVIKTLFSNSNTFRWLYGFILHLLGFWVLVIWL